MNWYSKRDRLASGVLFFAPTDVSRALSDTRRRGKKLRPPRNVQVRPASNFYSQKGYSESMETSGPDDVDVNTYAMFKTFPDVLWSTRSSTSPSSLSASTPNAQVPYPDPETYAELCLPILSVAVDVTVDGTVATTELKQRFRNPSQIEIPEARHTFPLYDGAVLTSFVCTIGTKRVLRGIVKPKEEARQAFEKAKKQKREAAALLEELTPEIFETSLGNIPPETTVEISLTYIHELKFAQMPQGVGLTVTVPTSIAPRYVGLTGTTASFRLQEDSLEIRLRVTNNGHINVSGCHIESRHDVTYEGETAGPPATVSSLEELMGLKALPQLVWQYTSTPPSLKSDLIFFIQVDETYLIGSRAVLSPTDKDGWAALMVNLRPSDLFSKAVKQNSFAGELIFVLDRSGSMGWTGEGGNELKIKAMRDAMSLALSGLHDTCAFNIISFGSEVRGMWAQSRKYIDIAALREARDYVSLLEADMGGTEVLEAIRAAVRTRDQSRASTQIILLTDGEVEDNDEQPTLELVRTTRKELGDKVRFFTLGIGDRVSHRMMEAIADLGGGYCDIVDVVERPRWKDRLNRMLRSAMGPDSWDCSIELGIQAERRTLMDQNMGADMEPESASIIYIQAPSPIPPLHPYAFKSIFFLLNLKDVKAPDKVTIRTMTPGTKDKAQEVVVGRSKSRAIHRLAVKAALEDMEDKMRGGTAETKIARSNAEVLGVKHSITSRWTSFVAVADDEAEKQASEVDLYKSLRKDTTIKDSLYLDASGDETSDDEESDHETSDDVAQAADIALDSLGGSDIPFGIPRKTRRMRRCASSESDDESDFTGHEADVRFEEEVAARLAADDSRRDRMERQGQRAERERLEREDWVGRVVPERERARLAQEDVDARRQAAANIWPADDLRRERIAREQIEEDRRRDLEREYQNVPDTMTFFSRWRFVDEDADSGSDSFSENGVSDIKEADIHQPSTEGPIIWKDAVDSQRSGLFILPDVVRTKLHQHFCTGSTERALEELHRFPACSALVSAEKAVLVDTLMMVAYFGMHLAVEEDTWCLIMDKAECAVQRELGLGEKPEEELQLELLSAILKASMEHCHFEQALRDSQVRQINQNKAPAEVVAKTCAVCKKSFGLADGAEEGAAKGFVCLSDECYAPEGRKVWDSWGSFWKHQVDHGHLLCLEKLKGTLLAEGKEGRGN